MATSGVESDHDRRPAPGMLGSTYVWTRAHTPLGLLEPAELGYSSPAARLTLDGGTIPPADSARSWRPYITDRIDVASHGASLSRSPHHADVLAVEPHGRRRLPSPRRPAVGMTGVLWPTLAEVVAHAQAVPGLERARELAQEPPKIAGCPAASWPRWRSPNLSRVELRRVILHTLGERSSSRRPICG